MKEKLFFNYTATKQKISLLAKLIKLEYSNEINLNNLSDLKLKLFCLKKIIKNPKRIYNVLTGKELNIPYIEIVLTTFCNLKCKGCSALMELYQNPSHIDLNDNIKSLQRIINSVDSIYTLRLLGGEPMCYPYLYDILYFLSKQDKIKKVGIVTNGTLVIKDNRLFEILKNNKFYFSISNYGDVSKNYSNLINQLEKNNINYTPMKETYEWIEYGDFIDRNKSLRVLEKQFNKCTRKKRSLINGKLFQCYRCSHATNLKLIPLKSEDYIDLFNENIKSEELRKLLYKSTYKYTKYVESCKYCDCIKNPKKISRGSQKKQPKQNSINIGDIIYYTPPFNYENNIGTYSWNSLYSTSSESGIKIIKNTNSDFKITKWRVLNIKENLIEIVPYALSCGRVRLQGPHGYNNAVFLLNELCQKLYGNNDKGITSRSININDLENAIEKCNCSKNLNKIKYTTKDFNKQAKAEYTRENSWYPIIYESEKNNIINGFNINNKILDMSDMPKHLIERTSYGAINEGKKQAEKSIWPYKTYYNTVNYKKTYSLLGKSKKEYSKILLPNNEKTEYWVASRCIGFGEYCAHYDVRLMYNGFFRACRLYASDDIAGGEEHPIFPIVSVDSSLIKSEIQNDKTKKYIID